MNKAKLSLGQVSELAGLTKRTFTELLLNQKNTVIKLLLQLLSSEYFLMKAQRIIFL